MYWKQAEGHELALNRGLTEEEKRLRFDKYYVPYHAAVDEMIAQTPAVPIIAMHSFTPVYEGKKRDMEFGILFDHSDEMAYAMADALRDQGFVVAMNEPYSGKNGMMYSAYRHAHEHGREALEFEIRQDLIHDSAASIAVADRVYNALVSLGLGRQ